jgi:hypothetical protein
MEKVLSVAIFFNPTEIIREVRVCVWKTMGKVYCVIIRLKLIGKRESVVIPSCP